MLSPACPLDINLWPIREPSTTSVGCSVLHQPAYCLQSPFHSYIQFNHHMLVCHERVDRVGTPDALALSQVPVIHLYVVIGINLDAWFTSRKIWLLSSIILGLSFNRRLPSKRWLLIYANTTKMSASKLVTYKTRKYIFDMFNRNTWRILQHCKRSLWAIAVVELRLHRGQSKYVNIIRAHYCCRIC